MKSNELVSIIMPTYNVGMIVHESIASVINQDYSNWELIVIDDCSTDNTLDVLLDYSKQDPRIRVYKNDKNSGAGISRNVGLQESKGRFISFLDSDDIWKPSKLRLQVNHMIENKAPICHTSFTFIDQVGQERAGRVVVSTSVDLKKNLKKTEIGTSTAMIDLSLVQIPFKFSTLRARQDLQLWVDLLGSGFWSKGLDIPLVKYRVRDGSVSSNKFKMLKVTFKVYMGVSSLSFKERLVCFLCYVINAIRKRTG